MMFFPRIVFQTSSRHNRDIRVIQEWGGVKLLVSGSRQSGLYIKKLWQRAFRAFAIQTFPDFTSILVLGVGGGTVIELLAALYPCADITAVDIDQTMIGIAKQYFHVDQVPRLHIVCKDANTYSDSKKRFDLIIVDLSIGREIPSFVSAGAFYLRLKRMLRPRGVLMVNFLREREYQKKSEALFSILTLIFSDVRDFPIANNRFFFCRS